ncbi:MULTISPECIES: sugar kinase [unclassified Pseudoalteromonas]|uniref:sugar kinase n=1 Tax=unclassified Pseudoalteromonas TaxID=194690 RepID=UPI00145A032A|nr:MULTISPECIES: sugar kinase [unclassified Pseudoalteromonas]MCG9709441.1 sugar kinase [Pseudoalteromonas sp. Isolate3]QWV06714.1 sugar kinase [Pseudoalteromonas shioyasakiensis]
MIKIAFFGEAMQELNDEHVLRFGGDVYNTAVYFKRLAPQADAQFVSAIGIDEISQAAQTLWRQQGLSLSFVQTSTDKTLGRYGITTDSHGERKFCYARSDSAAKQFFQLDTQHNFIESLRTTHFSHCYLSAISLAILDTANRQLLLDVLDDFKRAGGKVIFDSNYRSVLWQSEQATPFYLTAYKLADYLFVTDDDHHGVFGQCNEKELVSFYQQFTNKLVIIKQGVADTLVLNNKEIQRFTVQKAEHVVDTTSAGDAFSAGFLATYLYSHNTQQAISTAQQVALQVIAQKGAIVPTTIQIANEG